VPVTIFFALLAGPILAGILVSGSFSHCDNPLGHCGNPCIPLTLIAGASVSPTGLAWLSSAALL